MELRTHLLESITLILVLRTLILGLRTPILELRTAYLCSELILELGILLGDEDSTFEAHLLQVDGVTADELATMVRSSGCNQDCCRQPTDEIIQAITDQLTPYTSHLQIQVCIYGRTYRDDYRYDYSCTDIPISRLYPLKRCDDKPVLLPN